MHLWRVLVFIAAGSALGLAWNAASGRGIDLRQSVFVTPGSENILADEAKRRLDKGALFVDARGLSFYEMGHIPGALSLPEDEDAAKFEASFAKIEDRLRTNFDIVVYCSGYGCEASHLVARKLKEKGIQAAVLHDGMPAWEEAGYPTKQGTEP